MRARLAALVARLRFGRPRTSPVDTFDAILAASVETGAVITVPGIASWLGWTPPDQGDSGDAYAAYLERISRTEVAR